MNSNGWTQLSLNLSLTSCPYDQTKPRQPEPLMMDVPISVSQCCSLWMSLQPNKTTHHYNLIKRHILYIWGSFAYDTWTSWETTLILEFYSFCLWISILPYIPLIILLSLKTFIHFSLKKLAELCDHFLTQYSCFNISKEISYKKTHST